ncbi:MAG: sensor histidine kinase [Blautia sp.]|nr:sensor histidine kinase [Blautia sp.]
MTVINHWINFASILGEIILCVLTIRIMLKRRLNSLIPELLRHLAPAVFLTGYLSAMAFQEFCLSGRLIETYWIYLAIHVLFMVGYAVLFCDGDIRLRLVLPLNLVSFLILSRSPASLISGSFERFFPEKLAQLPLQACFLCILALIIIFLLFTKIDPETDYPVSYYTVLFFAPVVSMANSMLLYSAKGTNMRISAAAGSLSLIFQLLIFYMISQSSREYQRRTRLELIAHQQDYQNRYMTQLSDIVSGYHQIRHDMKNHIAVMDHLLSQERYDDLRQYFYSVNQSVYELDNQIETGNEILNEVINIKYAAAQRANIPITFHIQVPHSLPVPDHLICSLLSNLLDNALEASEQIRNPQIIVEMKMVKAYLSVTIKNRIEEWQKESAISKKTTKKDPHMHGLGTQIVNSIVAKYNGIQTNKVENDIFITSIMLDLSECH